MNRKQVALLTIVFFTLLALECCSAVRELLPLSDREAVIPTTLVKREPIDVRIYTRGELQPVKAATVIAPPVSGGTLQIIHIVKTGKYVNKGDIVVQFDPSEQEYNLEQNKSQLEEAEQKIKKMQADNAVRVAQEKVSLLKAESDVRRAELKIKGNALLSKIEARKNEIALEEAKRRLEQLQRDIRSNADSDAASLTVQTIARNKAMLAMKLARENIEKMTARAPIDGIVILGQNLQALLSSGGIIDTSNIPEYSEGHQAYPGNTIARIQGIERMEVHSKILETDRGNLAPGQDVEIWLDSRPMQPFAGTIKSIAASATSVSGANSTVELLESLSTRSFDILFEFDPNNEPIKLGTTAQIIIHGKDVENALSIPRQALFQRDGRPVVYVRNADGWNARNIQVKYVTESRAILEGIEEGSEVALVDPKQSKESTVSKADTILTMRGAKP